MRVNPTNQTTINFGSDLSALRMKANQLTMKWISMVPFFSVYKNFEHNIILYNIGPLL